MGSTLVRWALVRSAQSVARPVEVARMQERSEPVAARAAAGPPAPPRRRGGSFLRRMPISARLGATFALLFLVVLVALSVLAYLGLGRTLREEIDRSLVTAVNTFGDRPGRTDIDDRWLGGVESPEFDTQVITADGRVRSASDEDIGRAPLLSPDEVSTVLAEGALFRDVLDAEGEAHRALAVPAQDSSGDILLAVAELESVHDAQAGLLRLAVFLAPVAGLLAGGVGWLVARAGLRPVDRMTAEAEAISAQDPFPRLPVPPSGDEVARLGGTLNRMLARIEEARRREREFTADASHELRTPLAILRAEIELARNRATDETFARALDSALEESDRLGQLIDDLLLLARADAGQVTAREVVDVSEVVDELLPGFRTLAGRRGVTLTRVGDAAVRADRRALARAVGNLLDNAVRHAPDGTEVRVDVRQQDAGTSITVTDAGPGVPPEDRERLTQRFTQRDPSRTDGGAAGLGLAIVSSVAAAHDGRLTMAGAPSGTGLAVTIHLPSAPAPTDTRDVSAERFTC